MHSREIRIERCGVGHYSLQDLHIGFLVHPRDTGGKLAIVQLAATLEMTMNPVKYQNEDLLIYVCEGHLAVQLVGREEKLSRGDLAFVPRGNGHALHFTPSTNVLIAFSPGGIELPMFELAQFGYNPFGSSEATQELLIWDVVPVDLSQSKSTEHEPTSRMPHFVRRDEGDTYWLAGDEYTIKLQGSQTQGRFCVVHFLIPPGGGPVPHIHLREEEIFHILAGEASFYADGLIARGAVGDTVILPRGIPHAFRNASTSASEFLTFASPAGFDDFVRNVGVRSIPGVAPPIPDVTERERLMVASKLFGVKLLPDIEW